MLKCSTVTTASILIIGCLAALNLYRYNQGDRDGDCNVARVQLACMLYAVLLGMAACCMNDRVLFASSMMVVVPLLAGCGMELYNLRSMSQEEAEDAVWNLRRDDGMVRKLVRGAGYVSMGAGIVGLIYAGLAPAAASAANRAVKTTKRVTSDVASRTRGAVKALIGGEELSLMSTM